jgi:hypothetical protein
MDCFSTCKKRSPIATFILPKYLGKDLGDEPPPSKEENKKAADILVNEGTDAAAKHMFNPTGEKLLSYSEMRELYG